MHDGASSEKNETEERNGSITGHGGPSGKNENGARKQTRSGRTDQRWRSRAEQAAPENEVDLAPSGHLYIDRRLTGHGLPVDTVHEVSGGSVRSMHGATAAHFCAVIAAKAQGQDLLVSHKI